MSSISLGIGNKKPGARYQPGKTPARIIAGLLDNSSRDLFPLFKNHYPRMELAQHGD
jgi:hypothetical protein